MSFENAGVPFASGNILTQGFGIENTASQLLRMYQSTGLRGHDGLDIIPVNGDWSVLSVSEGEVIYAVSDYNPDRIQNPRWWQGNYVGIWDRANNRFWYYYHLSSKSVNVGDRVSRGQVIGVMGSSGNSTGAHLHLGCYPTDDNGSRINTDNGYFGAIDGTPFLEATQVVIPVQPELSYYPDSIRSGEGISHPIRRWFDDVNIFANQAAWQIVAGYNNIPVYNNPENTVVNIPKDLRDRVRAATAPQPPVVEQPVVVESPVVEQPKVEQPEVQEFKVVTLVPEVSLKVGNGGAFMVDIATGKPVMQNNLPVVYQPGTLLNGVSQKAVRPDGGEYYLLSGRETGIAGDVSIHEEKSAVQNSTAEKPASVQDSQNGKSVLSSEIKQGNPKAFDSVVRPMDTGKVKNILIQQMIDFSAQFQIITNKLHNKTISLEEAKYAISQATDCLNKGVHQIDGANFIHSTGLIQHFTDWLRYSVGYRKFVSWILKAIAVFFAYPVVALGLQTTLGWNVEDTQHSIALIGNILLDPNTINAAIGGILAAVTWFSNTYLTRIFKKSSYQEAVKPGEVKAVLSGIQS